VTDAKRLSIVFVARRYWPAIGGVETFLRDLAQGLAGEHDVSVLAHRIDQGSSTRLTDSLRPPPTFDAFDDGPVRVLPLRLSRSRRMLLTPLVAQVVPVLRRYAYGRARRGAAALYARAVAPVVAAALREADIVHVFGSDLVAAAGVRAARSAGVPAVVTPFAHRGQWGDDPGSAAAYRAADAVVALLRADAEVYRGLGVRDEQIHVCGICSRGAPGGDGAALRERHRIDGPLVLFLGARRPYKGFDVLLDAAPLVDRELGAAFAIVGPGATIGRIGGARVIDAGVVDDAERAAWLDAADLLCLPSRGEIFPVSVLEAWSAGTPVLSSDIPPLRELLEHGGGEVVSPEAKALASAISRLLRDPARLAAMGDRGRALWSRRYTVEVVTRWHAALYRELLGVDEAACAA
jgi:glycosyltransferase involved in cell wall biosynthesis